MSLNRTYSLIQAVYFGISIGSSYCVYVDNTYCDICVRVVWIMCGIDYVVHFIGWSRMRADMMIHHAFVSVLIGVLCRYRALSDLDLLHPQRHLLITSMLSTEISTMFLVVIPLYQTTVPTSWNSMVKIAYVANQLLFVTTFVYYLLYKYTINVLTNKQMHRYIYDELTYVPQFHLVKSESMQIVVYGITEMAIVGMWILNIYWFVLIVRKAYRKIENAM
jgi:hypothetical protein